MFFKAGSPNIKSLLTKKLQANDIVCEKFYLGCGTALALQLGHRRSEDIDFFSESEFRNEEIINFILKLGGSIDSESKGTLLGSIGGSKISFFHYTYPLVSDALCIGRIKIASVDDIAARKVIAIAQRSEKKDFFDMYEILKVYSPAKVKELLMQKYGEKRINCYHTLKSFFYFTEAEKSPDPVSLNRTTWKQVKQFFVKNERRLTSELCEIHDNTLKPSV